MKDAVIAFLERHQAMEFRQSEQTPKVIFSKPGIVILARDNADGTPRLLSSLYARNDAGAVATSLLHLQAATGKDGHFVLILPVAKLYEASRIQMEFQEVCEADPGLPIED
jgi:hypothetical protein